MAPSASNSRRSGRPTRGDVREQAILDTAAQLLASSPLDALTVESIASGAGISRASLYFYFGSKEDVALAVARRSMAVLADEPQAVAGDEDIDPLEAVRRVIDRVEDVWRTNGPILRLVRDRANSNDAFGDLWRRTLEVDIAAADLLLRRAGLLSTGSASSRAIATLLCHMTADAYARASKEPASERQLRATSASLLVVWRSVIAGAAAGTAGV